MKSKYKKQMLGLVDKLQMYYQIKDGVW